MEYTKNYHFPQWAENDRIMMQDFNQMCADMEKGLLQTREQGGQAASDLEQQTLRRLRRMGFDLYRAASLTGGAKHGMVCNGLKTPEELARTDGMLALAGGGCGLGPSTGMTLARLNSAITSWENGSAPGISDPATAKVRFHASWRGTITKLNFWYHRTCVNTTGQINFYVKLFDEGSGRYTYQSPAHQGKVMGAVDTTDAMTVAVPVEAGRDYRLELYTTGGLFTGTIGFGTMGTNALTGTVTSTPLSQGTAQESADANGPVSQVVAVVHYTGGSQIPAITVNGQAMTAESPRQGQSLRGDACTEQEFVLSGSWTGPLSLNAVFQAAGKDMTVYDWGAYLI